MPPMAAPREPRPEDEYADEIYEHLFARQHASLRDATYLQRQREALGERTARGAIGLRLVATQPMRHVDDAHGTAKLRERDDE